MYCKLNTTCLVPARMCYVTVLLSTFCFYCQWWNIMAIVLRLFRYTSAGFHTDKFRQRTTTTVTWKVDKMLSDAHDWFCSVMMTVWSTARQGRHQYCAIIRRQLNQIGWNCCVLKSEVGALLYLVRHLTNMHRLFVVLRSLAMQKIHSLIPLRSTAIKEHPYRSLV